jgi:hypothetical protein
MTHDLNTRHFLTNMRRKLLEIVFNPFSRKVCSRHLGIFWFLMSINTSIVEMKIMKKVVITITRIVIVWLRRQIRLLDLSFSLLSELLNEITVKFVVVNELVVDSWSASLLFRLKFLLEKFLSSVMFRIFCSILQCCS